jgi:molybdopterin-containing oxidoreductase family iron-sulfur binding subunit
MDFLRLGVRKTSTQKLSKEADPQKALMALDAKDFTTTEDSLEVLLVPDFHALDGRFINNGWMQECPHPITKLTWDNALLISPVLAKSLEKDYPNLGLLPKPTMLNKNGQIAPDNAVFDNGYQKAPVVRISLSDDKFIEGPLYVQPGLADQTIVASLGMGRKNTGRVGHGTGYDAFPLLSEDGNRIISDISLKPTGEYQILANTQEHWSMEGRAIVREANLNEYVEDEDFAHHMGAESHSPPIWGKDQDKDLAYKTQTTPRGNSAYEHPDHNYEHSETHGLHQWGMAIDLNQCTGCSACVVACQSENNIPIVGKDQVLRGREMHWMRLDRYYSSTERDGTDIPSDVQVSFQGVSCMHCETAPCESVCPVNATVHDEEGLNAMAYNRCVGTRYCANNCPYKVRRFNFFDWNKRNINELYKGPLGEENDPLPSMGKNPDVTVRMRGVMEKCTYCVQRIQEAKIRIKVKAQRKAKLTTGLDGSEMKLETKDIKVPDGTIRPACQQVCPSDGVAFGDLSDPDSRVSQLTNDPRNYSVLGYLNTRPRTTYLAKVRNPNPQMPDYSASPHAAREYHDKAHPSHHGDEHHGEHNEQKESKH